MTPPPHLLFPSSFPPLRYRYDFSTQNAAPPRLSKPLENWEEYYQWRHVSLESPVCLLLHFPLTIYQISKNKGMVEVMIQEID